MTRRFVLLLLALAAGVCPAAAQPPAHALRARVVVTGLSLPTNVVGDPLDPTVMFVLQKHGLIRVVVGGQILPTPFLDLTGQVSIAGEGGVLGLAFPPDHATSRRVYVSFNNLQGHSVVARYLRPAGTPYVLDTATRFDLRWGGPFGDAFIVQPASTHNGGHIAFGPDGMFYLGLGDGGQTPADAQSTAGRLGKILRVDVNVPLDHLQGYVIPADNPFVDNDPVNAPDETWAFGLRNPWRFDWDPPARGGNGGFVIADVGQLLWEELNYVPPGGAGRNFGWPIREGRNDYDTGVTPAYVPLSEPFYEYSHAIGSRSVTGGHFYRGTLLPPYFRGRYFFGDFISGRVWSMAIPLTGGEANEVATGDPAYVAEHTSQLGGLTTGLSSFGLDARGDIYALSYFTNRLVRLLPRQTFGDFNDDGVMDRVTFDTASGVWTIEGQFSADWGQAGDLPVPGDYDGDFHTDLAVFRPSTGIWYVRGVLAVQFGAPGDVPVPADYDGDGRTDIAVFRPSTGVWYVLRSSTGFTTSTASQYGQQGDVPLPGDYDGDGVAEPAVFRRATGVWYVSSGAIIAWGQPSDIPVPADYDGDGLIDIAVFRPGSATWFIRGRPAVQVGQPGDHPRPMDVNGDRRAELTTYRPATGTWTHHDLVTGATTMASFGGPGLVAPIGPGIGQPLRAVHGDLDGDRRADVAVFRPSTGVWHVLQSSTGYLGGMQIAWGIAGDRTVPGDYLGLGFEQAAVFRPSNGAWYVAGGPVRVFGVAGDEPVPADYDGDGRTDIAVFRPSTGVWYVLTSSSGFLMSTAVQWGQSGDRPVAADYDGDGRADMAAFRPSVNVWYLRLSSGSASALPFGVADDEPLPGDYAGVGRVSIAIFRPSTGEWRAFGNVLVDGLGVCGCWLPGAADHDGDGRVDLRGVDGLLHWELRFSAGGAPFVVSFGAAGDEPIAPRP